jgi:glycosyltransferase involved in cell wall biosynthesis
MINADSAPPEAAKGQIDVHLRGDGRDPRMAWRLLRLIRAHDIELIHALAPRVAPISALAGRLADIPTVATRAAVRWMPDHAWLRRILQRAGWALYLRGVDRLLVPSELVRRNLGYIAEASSAKTQVVYPGLTPPPFVAAPESCAAPGRAALGLPDGPLVGLVAMPEGADEAAMNASWLARLPKWMERRKLPSGDGLSMAFDALHRMIKRNPGLHLVVAGPNAAEVQRRAATIRPALPIRWHSQTDELWAVIAACDVIIDTSPSEGIPRGLVMAALCGKPIVAPRLPGISELIEANVSGLLVTPEDASDMAAQVHRLLHYEGLAGRLGRMARRRALERFTVSAQGQIMTELYEAVIYAAR